MNVAYNLKPLGKTKQTLDRIEEVQKSLQVYQGSMTLLHDFNEGGEALASKGYCETAICYQRTPGDIRRYRWTLNNLKTQIAILERELEVLITYGA